MSLVDIHCHTAGMSPDSSLSVARAVADANAAGVDAICLTEHDAFRDPSEDMPTTPAFILPGVEVNTDAGHVLVFGLTAYRFGFHHPRELAAAAERVGGAMVYAHPYRRALPPGVAPNTQAWEAALARALENPLLRLVDAVEVVNGRASEAENRFAFELARASGLRGVAGSDAHRDGEAGQVFTRFDRPVRSAEDLIRELKAGWFHPARSSAAAGEAGRQQL
ncbi:MAG: PHP domain-containing protein [Chloroflexi bacterium]|nr:PHP domain-containing protein [Chloroflexota bacterium]